MRGPLWLLMKVKNCKNERLAERLIWTSSFAFKRSENQPSSGEFDDSAVAMKDVKDPQMRTSIFPFNNDGGKKMAEPLKSSMRN